MHSSRETRILNTICVVLVLLVGPVRIIGYQYEKAAYNNIICILFCAAAFIWLFQIRKRVIQPEERRYLTGIALLMIFWIVLQTIRYEYIVDEYYITRFVWYLYYVPQTFCAALMLLSVLHIGRPYDRPICRRWKLIYVPSAIIVAGVLTNDLHQLAFRFPYGLKDWNRVDYIYGPYYYAALLWIAVLFLAILVITFTRCSVPGRRRKLWMPLLPLFIGVFYCILYWHIDDSMIRFMYRMSEVMCFVFAAFLEGLMLAHLIPTNDSYEDFWNASSIGAGIMNQSDEICYRSLSSVLVTPDQIRGAQQEDVFLENGNVILKSCRIHGGFGYWFTDISEINRLNQELSDLGDMLNEENAMLNAENEMREKRIRIEQQNRLYINIAQQVSPQLDRLGRILDSLPEEEKAFEKEMKYACILNTYVKRYSNLLLLSHQNEWISSGELRLSLMESLEYVRFYGIMTHGSYQGEAFLPGDWILLAYRVFEVVLETAIPGAKALLVNLYTMEQCLVLRLEIDLPGVSLPSDFMKQEIETLHGKLHMERERNTEYVSLSFRAGGERE